MGGGRFDRVTYSSAVRSRALAGTDDFAYTQQAVKTKQIHPNLDPARIRTKPFKKLESRDSEEHPASNAVLVCLDVTGSNIARAREVQAKLPNLMEKLEKYLSDPQVAVAGNDDFRAGIKEGAIQISDFESDNRIDDHIRNLWLVNAGGGNMGESYDLVLYAAARKTILDCVEKRKRKGYLFMYADEPIFENVRREEVSRFFGDAIKTDIPIKMIIDEVRELYHLFVIWPNGGYIEARDQFCQLFGKESVFTLQNPSLMCELICSLVGLNEEKLSEAEAEEDLVAAGAGKAEAKNIVKSVVTIRRKFKLEEAPAGD